MAPRSKAKASRGEPQTHAAPVSEAWDTPQAPARIAVRPSVAPTVPARDVARLLRSAASLIDPVRKDSRVPLSIQLLAPSAGSSAHPASPIPWDEL